ncbi:MAG: efflux RND transporter periplasmic adaptor subunit [Bacteroidales bacterium]|nr:efflux RND transporter periplasmic adaptor subunit [Bacteroidales bacterium]MCF8399308.1 efflux RND transporter periplasmic adaptor subunit [Bacteroidales bacterium]
MKKKSKSKKILIWAGIIVLLILVVLAVVKKKDSTGIRVSTDTVERRTIVETVSANGKIQPEVDVMISPYISGEVVKLYVKEGDKVEKGDILARIDPEIYKKNFERQKAALNTQKANLANARARLAQAKAQATNEKVSFQRQKTLWEQDVISDAEFDAAKASYEVAQAEVEAAKESVKAAEYSVKSAEASFEEAEENLRRTNIYSPNDGSVSKLSVEEGERVTGASQFSAGTEIMRIANLLNMEVHVEVNENDIVRVHLNDTAIIEVDAYPDMDFRGLVTEIATSANVTGVSADQVTNFDVKIRILHDSYRDLITRDSASPFMPGMSATVDIQTETAVNIISVPIQAVTTRTDTSGKAKSTREKMEEEKAEKKGVETEEEMLEVVFLYQDEKAKLVVVETGIQDNTYIEILTGLEAGQEVISAPYRAVSKQLENNDAVSKVPKEDLFKED